MLEGFGIAMLEQQEEDEKNDGCVSTCYKYVRQLRWLSPETSDRAGS